MINIYSNRFIDEVYEIEKETYKYPWIKSQFSRYSLEESNSVSCVYTFESRIIGYLMAEIILDEVHIHNLVVKKIYRNNNIARNLVEYLINKSKFSNKNKVCLEVNCANFSALSLYNSIGFQKVGKRKQYYQDGKDAILMDFQI
tara:strand:+ start:173 stop:604 length:432 start_codon:yes stop_codon:yes gene_type:complete